MMDLRKGTSHSRCIWASARFSHVGFEARRVKLVKLKRILHKRFSKVLILFRNSSLTFAVIVVSLCALFLLGFLLLAYRVKARGQKQKFQVILSSLNIFDEVITWSRVMMATSRQIQHQLWLRISPLVLMMAILWKASLTIRKLCRILKRNQQPKSRKSADSHVREWTT